MRFWILCLILIFQTSYAGVDSPQSLVLNNEQSLIRSTTVRIEYYNPRTSKFTSFCSGFLNQSGEVITATHCNSTIRDNASQAYVSIYSPKTKRYERFQIRGVSSAKPPGSSYTADISVVSFIPPDDPNLLFNQSLPVTTTCDQDSPIFSAGFGINNEHITGKFNINQYEWTPEKVNKLNPKQFRLKAVNGKVCGGDSGGPVYCRYKGRLSLLALNEAITGKEKDISYNVEHLKVPANECRSMNMLNASKADVLNTIIDGLRQNAKKATLPPVRQTDSQGKTID